MCRENNQPYTIVVASDLHLMHPHLMRRDGEAFQRVLEADRKLLIESEKIFDQLINEVADLHPDVLLLPGDLTKDGECISHQLLVEKLQILQNQGIAVCVIPGNHDINNPHSRYYDGDDYVSARNITPNEFRELYAPFGYSSDIVFSEGPGLSYVNEPVEGLWVIGIDSCIYANNMEEGYPRTHGQLTEETLLWIERVMGEAKKMGKSVIAMVHHNILEHFPFQSFIAPEYVIKDWVRSAERLVNAGVRAIFTGHFHAQNVASKRFENGIIFDIETGSIVTFPCPYRVVDLYPDRMEVATQLLSPPQGFTHDHSIQDYAYEHLKSGIPGMAKYLSNYVRIKYPKLYSEEKAQSILNMIPHFIPLIMDVYTGHLKGNQSGLRYNPNPADAIANPMSGDLLRQLRQIVEFAAPKYAPLLEVIEGFLHSSALDDNELTIPL